MRGKAKRFLTDWVSNNIDAKTYKSAGDNSEARELAARCRAAAAEEHLSPNALNVAARDLLGGGADLVGFIGQALESTTDAEVQRLADKDG